MRAFEVFIIFLALMLLVNCESQSETEKDGEQPNPAASSSASTTVEPETNLSKLPDGESRATKGHKIEKTPPFLGHVFSSIREPTPGTFRDPHQREGRLSGFSLHLDDKHAIVHHQSLDKLTLYNARDAQAQNGPHIMVPAWEKIHVNEPTRMIRPFGPYDPINKIQENLGGSNFHLARLKLENDPKLLHSPTDHPKLERNKHEFGSDCHMLAYSSTSNSRSAFNWTFSDPGPKKQEGREQEMVKIHVDKVGGNCDKGFCNMRVNSDKSPDAKVCAHKQDLGAPILCGHQKKVTYLANPTKTGSNKCDLEFSAFHVPHLIHDVEKHVNLAALGR